MLLSLNRQRASLYWVSREMGRHARPSLAMGVANQSEYHGIGEARYTDMLSTVSYYFVEEFGPNLLVKPFYSRSSRRQRIHDGRLEVICQ